MNKYFLRYYEVPKEGGGGDPWYHGKVDDRLLGHMQNVFPTVMADPSQLALAAVKSHSEAVKLIGADPKQMIKIPASPSDGDGWKALWSRLGVPAEAKDYDLKTADGKPLDPKLDAALRAGLHSANVPKDAASQVTAAILKHLNDTTAASEADRTAALNTQREKLKADWGQNFDANLFAAKNAAAALKVSPEQVAALEGSVGYAAVMEMFRNIATRIGEAKYIDGGAGGHNGVMTAAQAKDRVALLKADRAWQTRYFNGDAEAVKEMNALMVIVAGAS